MLNLNLPAEKKMLKKDERVCEVLVMNRPRPNILTPSVHRFEDSHICSSNITERRKKSDTNLCARLVLNPAGARKPPVLESGRPPRPSSRQPAQLTGTEKVRAPSFSNKPTRVLSYPKKRLSDNIPKGQTFHYLDLKNNKKSSKVLPELKAEDRKPLVDKLHAVLNQGNHRSESGIPAKPSEPRQGDLARYEIGQIIGQGAYAVVKKGNDKTSGDSMAFKVYDRLRLLDPSRKQGVQREIAILKKLSHPYIVHLFDILDSPRQLILVTELVKGRSLYRYLKRHERKLLPEVEALRIFKQLCEGVAYCHSNGVCHRDLKLENILLDHNNNVKIIDFGFSTFYQHHSKLRAFCGTPSYMAPEIVRKLEYFGPPVDMWSLGVVLYAMVCGTYPFRAESERELYRKIAKGDFTLPSHISKQCRELIRRLLLVAPQMRATAADLLKEL